MREMTINCLQMLPNISHFPKVNRQVGNLDSEAILKGQKVKLRLPPSFPSLYHQCITTLTYGKEPKTHK